MQNWSWLKSDIPKIVNEFQFYLQNGVIQIIEIWHKKVISSSAVFYDKYNTNVEWISYGCFNISKV